MTDNSTENITWPTNIDTWHLGGEEKRGGGSCVLYRALFVLKKLHKYNLYRLTFPMYLI